MSAPKLIRADEGIPVRDVALVFGASGYIGSHLVPFLTSRGQRVRAVSRNRLVLEGREWPDVECASADALRSETLAQVRRDVDVAYYLVHSMAAGGNFNELDLRAAANFRDAAAQAGIRRIIYLGGLIPNNPDAVHLQSRYETGEILRAARQTGCWAGQASGADAATLTNYASVMWWMPGVSSPFIHSAN
jgi:uncharacterized protein YbjT (DUF2867 family)